MTSDLFSPVGVFSRGRVTRFPSHFSAVLSRHLPAIGSKSAAAAMGTDLRTVYRYVDGECIPPIVERLGQLHRAIAMSQKGRGSFLTELFEYDDTTHSWFTPSGSFCPAREGLDPAARGHLRLHPDVPGDAAAAYRRSLGAVSLSVRGADVEIHYHERSLSPEAAQTCAGWLGGRQAIVRRKVDLEELDGPRTITLPVELSQAAAEAIEAAGKAARLPAPRRWNVARLSCDDLRSDAAIALAKLVNRTDSEKLVALDRSGLTPLCSIVRVEGENAITLTVGPHLAEYRTQWIGKPMMSKPDIRYAECTQALAIETLNGPVYTEQSGPIYGAFRHYRRFGVPLGHGLVASITEPLAA